MNHQVDWWLYTFRFGFILIDQLLETQRQWVVEVKDFLNKHWIMKVCLDQWIQIANYSNLKLLPLAMFFRPAGILLCRIR